MPKNLSKALVEQLKERWNTPEGILKRNSIINCLIKNKPLDRLDFIEKVNGYYDLRGITFDIKTNLRRVKLKNIDFTYSDLNYLIVDNSTIENVIFDEVDGAGFNHYSSFFKNCTFTKAYLNRAALGTHKTKYENVLFERADLRGAFFYNGTFTDCVFSDCKLKGVDFRATHFIRVKFKGKLDNVWFRGTSPYDKEREAKKHGLNPMLVDFSDATLWDITFSNNCDLSKVILPNDGNHVLINNWGKVLKELDAQADRIFLDEACRVEARDFADIHSGHAREQSMYILNRKSLERMHKKYLKEKAPEFAEKLMDIILRINAELMR